MSRIRCQRDRENVPFSRNDFVSLVLEPHRLSHAGDTYENIPVFYMSTTTTYKRLSVRFPVCMPFILTPALSFFHNQKSCVFPIVSRRES